MNYLFYSPQMIGLACLAVGFIFLIIWSLGKLTELELSV